MLLLGILIMRNEGFEVTFGVEVEAFHEAVLQGHLNTSDTTCTIVNDLPEVSRRDLCIALPACTLEEDHQVRDKVQGFQQTWRWNIMLNWPLRH